MKTEYQYIAFIKTGDTGKTTKWSCRNKRYDAELGEIKWFGGWRQYCFFPTCQAVYSAGCLKDIADFIKALSDIQRTIEAK
jgi:hypothetical protein